MNTLGNRVRPNFARVWLKPRITAAPVANRSATRTSPIAASGRHDSSPTPRTMPSVPARIRVLSSSPSRATAVIVANTGEVAENVAATVWLVRAVAS